MFSYDFETQLLIRRAFNKPLFETSFYKAILKNAGFRSLATANEKVQFAILSQDIELVKYALQDPAVDHNATCFNPLMLACRFGEAETIEYILSNADINSESFSRAFKIGRCAAIRILLSDSRFDSSDQNNLAIIDIVIRSALVKLGALENIRLLVSDQRVYPSANVTQAILMEIPLVEIEIIKRLLFDQRLNLSVLDLCYIFIYRFFGDVDYFLFNLWCGFLLMVAILFVLAFGRQVLDLLYISIYRFFESVYYLLAYLTPVYWQLSRFCSELVNAIRFVLW